MRIAHQAPVKCSGCFSQKHDHPHVDFESAFDGPLIDPDRPRSGHIDWLVVCDECIRTAHSLLPEQADRVKELEAEVARLTASLAEEQNFAAKLEDAMAARPVRRAPKPATAKKRAA